MAKNIIVNWFLLLIRHLITDQTRAGETNTIVFIAKTSSECYVLSKSRFDHSLYFYLVCGWKVLMPLVVLVCPCFQVPGWYRQYDGVWQFETVFETEFRLMLWAFADLRCSVQYVMGILQIKSILCTLCLWI